MAKIRIVNLSDLSIATPYEADAPNQKAYGGPWGDPKQTVHLVVPEGVDEDCLKVVTVPAVGSPEDPNYEPEHLAIVEDVDLKAAKDAEAPRLMAEAAVRSARALGNKMVEDFSVENVMLGITQDGMTGEVLDKMQGVIVALQSGSLYEAMDRMKAIPELDKDAKYVTDARLLAAVNQIEEHLGMVISQSL